MTVVEIDEDIVHIRIYSELASKMRYMKCILLIYIFSSDMKDKNDPKSHYNELHYHYKVRWHLD